MPLALGNPIAASVMQAMLLRYGAMGGRASMGSIAFAVTALLLAAAAPMSSGASAAWIYARSGSRWTKQGPMLKGDGEMSAPGSSATEAGCPASRCFC